MVDCGTFRWRGIGSVDWGARGDMIGEIRWYWIPRKDSRFGLVGVASWAGKCGLPKEEQCG